MRLHNVYGEEEVFVWMKLDVNGPCLDVFPATAWAVGFAPKWWEDEVAMGGIESPISTRWTSSHDGYSDMWIHFGLHFGVAPKQPFLVHVKEPRYYRSSYEYDEWDVEWDWDLVKAVPLSPEKAARRWEASIAAVRAERDAMTEARRALMKKAAEDTSAMFLKTDVYWTRYYDEQSPPDGTICRLYSSHGNWIQLAEGRSDNGHEKALDNLVSTAMKKFPHLEESTIRSLPRKY